MDKMLPDPPLTVSSVSHCLTSSTNLALPSVRVEFVPPFIGCALHDRMVSYRFCSRA